MIASWIHRKISFSVIKSIGMCIRGSRSVTSSNNLLTSTTNDAVASEVISNIVSVWIYEHFPLFYFIFFLFFFFFVFLLEVCDWEEIQNVSGKKINRIKCKGNCYGHTSISFTTGLRKQTKNKNAKVIVIGLLEIGLIIVFKIQIFKQLNIATREKVCFERKK